MKTFSPEPSETMPVLVEQDRLVVAGVGDSVLARIELRYWPEALACGIELSPDSIRRQQETLARMPRSVLSSPR